MHKAALALALALVAAPALAGCLENGDGSGPGGPGDEDEEPLSLTLEPEETTLALPGEQSWTATLTVRENTTITHRGCPPELVDVMVELPGDAGEVRLYAYGEEGMAGACAVREVELEPGTYTFHADWNGRVDGNQPEPHQGEAVEPGTYTVTARLAAQDRDVTAEGTVTIA